MADAPDLAFVACVESGPLEDQATRLLLSRARFAGAFARCPFYLVKARRGPALSGRLRQIAADAGATILDVPGVAGWEWMQFLNKPVALTAVEARAANGAICWIDSDVLFLQDPWSLILPPGVDFTACPADKNVGTSGPDDANEPYWQAVCLALGLDLSRLPMLVTAAESVPVRFYCNSGVFAYRTKSRFGQAFLNDCLTLLAARVASKNAGIFFTDQVVMGLTALRLDLPFAALPFSHNRTMGSKSHATVTPQGLEGLREAALLHYHDAMWPHFWPTLLKCLEQSRPEAAEWLRGLGPMTNPASLPARLLGKGLNLWRARKRRAYLGGCHVW